MIPATKNAQATSSNPNGAAIQPTQLATSATNASRLADAGLGSSMLTAGPANVLGPRAPIAALVGSCVVLGGTIVSVVLEQVVHALPKHEPEATIQIDDENMAALVVEQSKERRVAARLRQQLATNRVSPQPHGSPVRQRNEPMQMMVNDALKCLVGVG